MYFQAGRGLGIPQISMVAGGMSSQCGYCQNCTLSSRIQFGRDAVTSKGGNPKKNSCCLLMKLPNSNLGGPFTPARCQCQQEASDSSPFVGRTSNCLCMRVPYVRFFHRPLLDKGIYAQILAIPTPESDCLYRHGLDVLWQCGICPLVVVRSCSCQASVCCVA